MKKNNKFIVITSVIMMCFILFVVFGFSDDKELQKEVVEKVTNAVTDIATYEMTEEEIKDLPTTEIVEQTEVEENKVSEEQEVESEAFEEQGEIAYNGTSEYPSVSLGDYKGLTYYSQIDSRWSNKPYTSCGNYSQTIGSSGCGPTCASMIVTATKGTITPDTMSDLFVRYGYRSSNNGTYFSAFRFVADTFNIGYEETYRLDDAVNLLRNNHYVVVSCANGLFTTGGHFIVLVGIDGDTIKIYDPYLYAGKFETSTRRGKVRVEGNTVYCSIDNFRNYANYTKFFAYAHNGNVTVNNVQPVVTSGYTRYVNTNSKNLNVRNTPNGAIVGSLRKGTQVTVYATSGNWSNIGTNRWVSSDFLSDYTSTNKTTITGYRTGTYKVTKVSNKGVLNVRFGASTKYSAKNWRQLSANARSQNSRLGNYYTNGYRKGVVCTVTKINGNWGYTVSGWICLDFCSKI